MESADRVGFIVHKGKQVLVVDFTDCTPDEVTAVTVEVVRIVTAQPEHSVLLMADFAGAQFSKDAVTRIKEATNTPTRLFLPYQHGPMHRRDPNQLERPGWAVQLSALMN